MNELKKEVWMGLSGTQKWDGLRRLLLGLERKLKEEDLPMILDQVKLYMEDVPEIYKKEERESINYLLSKQLGENNYL